MRTIEIHVPDDIDLKDQDFSMIIASKLYEDGKLSAGQAAKVAGLSKRAFPEVAQEFSGELPHWITIEKVTDKKYQEILEMHVDWGEASAIALAKEMESPLLLLDNLKARKLAAKLNLKYTGTLGVIHRAKQMGVIEKVKPFIKKLLLTDFRIAESILNELLKKNNEVPD